MIKVSGLTFKYKQEQILNNLNLEINDGDFLAIVGPNGSGKSTFLRCLMGINKVEHDQINIDGACISCYKDFKSIGYVPQVKIKATELAISGREYFNLITSDKNKINDIIIKLKIENIIDKNINNLSGGQLQRINIAKAMLNDIKYLVLDEPNTGLDAKSRKELFEFLSELNKFGLTIIIVSHHLDEIKMYTNKIFDLQKNEVIEVEDVKL